MKSFKSIISYLKSIKLAVFMLMGMIGVSVAFASDGGVEQIVQKADTAYSKGEFDVSVALYEKAIKENGATASLLFNLANAYYKNGNEGEARLYLERAKKLDPSNTRINQNIEYLQSRVQDANKAELKGKKGSVAPDEEGFFSRVRRSVAVDTSSNSWADMAVMAFILLILALVAYFFSPNVRIKKIGFFSGIILLFFAVVFIIFSEMAASHFESHDQAVITTFKTTLAEEPQSAAKSVGFPLHRGSKLQILETRLNAEGEVSWYKVKLNSSNIGWLPASDITVI